MAGIMVPERLRETFWQCLERRQTTGAATGVAPDGSWVCIRWENIGPRWIAVGVGDGETDEAARALAEERVAHEIAKHGDHPQPGCRVRKAGI